MGAVCEGTGSTRCVSVTQLRKSAGAGIMAKMVFSIAVSTAAATSPAAKDARLQRHVEIRHADLVLTELHTRGKEDVETDSASATSVQQQRQKRRSSSTRAP